MQENLTSYFQDKGFIVVEDGNYNGIGISPDIVFEKDSIVKAIVIRDSAASLPDSMVQRYATSKRIPSKTLELYFAFPAKPPMNILRSCKLFAVGILYQNSKGEIELYAESKQIKGRLKRSSIPKTQMFFSSRQILEEREVARVLVDDFRDSLKVPLYPMLVENDSQYSSDIRKLWQVICRCMDDCDYVLVVLTGEYRKIINDETRRALEYYDPEDILFYVKNDKETKEQWADLLQYATDNGVRYYEYFDLRDFKLRLNARVMKVIKDLHTMHDVDFLGE